MSVRRLGVVASILLLAAVSASAQRPPSLSFGSVISTSSRPISGTVVSTHVVRNGELALLVLWRGSPGWFNAAEKGGSAGGFGGGGGGVGRHETGFETMSYGGRSFLMEFDYTDGTAKLLDQQISLTETNVVLVDDVDAPAGPRIVDRRRIEPAMPAPSRPVTLDGDPAIVAIRRDPVLVAFIQCNIPTPVPPGLAAATLDDAARARLSEYLDTSMRMICR